MFGYVNINKPELKIKDYEQYRSYYCGLCRVLKKRHGRSGQITLTYDMTFLIILLTSLYEPETVMERHGCILHPVRRRTMRMNEITAYAADMNVALSYHHFRDDWADEKKWSGAAGSLLFQRKYNKVYEKYERQCLEIEASIKKLAEYEREGNTEPDEISRPFGECMSSIMAYKEDAFAPRLRKIGFHLGKFIYLMDAWMDLEEDLKKGCFNPFMRKAGEKGLETWVRELLVLYVSEAVKEVERLPLEWDICILRNILYEGVWTKYERKKKRENDV